MSENTSEMEVFNENDEVEATELYKKDSLIKGATVKGTVVSSDTNYTYIITDDGLHSHIRTRHLRKVG